MNKNIIHLLWGAALVIGLGVSFSTCSDDVDDLDLGNSTKLLPLAIHSEDDTYSSKHEFTYDSQNRIISIQKSVGSKDNVSEIQNQYTLSYNDKGQLARVKITKGKGDKNDLDIIQDFEYLDNTIKVTEIYEREDTGELTFNYILKINNKKQLTKMTSDDLMQYYEFVYDAKGNLAEATEFESEGKTVAFKDIYLYDESTTGLFANVAMPAWYYQFDRSNEFALFSSPNVVSERSTFISDESGLHESGITNYAIEKKDSKMLTKMMPSGDNASKQTYNIEYLE